MRQGAVLAPLVLEQLEAVMAIEVRAYAYPWSRGNFVDALASGYHAQGLWGANAQGQPELWGYAWAMEGVDEVHLLNLTVSPEHQRRGHAQVLLWDLARWSMQRHLPWMWLEVRASNEPARSLYRRLGFEEAGLRRRYYPAARSTREDAVLMRWDLNSALAARDGQAVAAEVGR